MSSGKEEIISIRGLKKSFGRNEVLKGIDLTLQKKELLTILGRSGNGKSVLLKCLVRLIEPDGGVNKMFDKEIAGLGRMEMEEIRRKVGYNFQGGALYDSMTVRENMAFPLERLFTDTILANKVVRVLDLLDRTTHNFSKISGDLVLITDQIKAGEGTMGKLITDTTWLFALIQRLFNYSSL